VYLGTIVLKDSPKCETRQPSRRQQSRVVGSFHNLNSTKEGENKAPPAQTISNKGSSSSRVGQPPRVQDAVDRGNPGENPEVVVLEELPDSARNGKLLMNPLATKIPSYNPQQGHSKTKLWHNLRVNDSTDDAVSVNSMDSHSDLIHAGIELKDVKAAAIRNLQKVDNATLLRVVNELKTLRKMENGCEWFPEFR